MAAISRLLAVVLLLACVCCYATPTDNTLLQDRNDAPALDSLIGEGANQEALAQRTFFYNGGSYVYNETIGGTISVGKQYVEKLTPSCGVKQKHPIVFFHGGGDTGVQWLNKPDGGQGWASYFLKKGYEVYIVDIWSVGRSADSALSPLRTSATTESSERAFSAPEKFPYYYQARFHTQWPGNGSKGDPIFDAFYATLLPLTISTIQQTYSQSATCALLRTIGHPSILITHSAGGSVAFLATDACPDLVAGHVALEADQTPFTNFDNGTFGAREGLPTRPYGISLIPLNYSPPIKSPDDLKRQVVGTLEETEGRISKYPCIQQDVTKTVHTLPNVAKAPVLFLTTEASIHALYDQCLVAYLRQAGVEVEFVRLEDRGIRGNGHFMMLEKNSDVIAGLADEWIGGLEGK
ncbi:uncharacterized protein KY384_005656 [Bacidia gigantensis]|uniref:uncharacterized protein n=1 Tax=Bacidia gigantensis TaxID=2732470 RepID=UPI001D0547AE|nr:uncharacterized protein KY384_005656 [Bacidia gigantensis]KAG8530173.1 hypothetical protein KY384_005656 [Bacidia gigantensis]